MRKVYIILLVLFVSSCSNSHKNLQTSKIRTAESYYVNFNTPDKDYFTVRAVNENMALKVMGDVYHTIIANKSFEIKIDSFTKQINPNEIFKHQFNFNNYKLLTHENDQNFGLVNVGIETYRTYVKYNDKIRFGEIVSLEMIDNDYIPAETQRFNLKKLKFEGFKHDTVKIGHYHYKKQYTTPDKIEHFKFDVSKSQIITCKGLKINIFEVDDKTIKYKILDNSAKDNVFGI